jgi:hypothetical protein
LGSASVVRGGAETQNMPVFRTFIDGIGPWGAKLASLTSEQGLSDAAQGSKEMIVRLGRLTQTTNWSGFLGLTHTQVS